MIKLINGVYYWFGTMEPAMSDYNRRLFLIFGIQIVRRALYLKFLKLLFAFLTCTLNREESHEKAITDWQYFSIQGLRV